MHQKVETPSIQRIDHYSDEELRRLLGEVTAEIAKRANARGLTAEQADEISRRST